MAEQTIEQRVKRILDKGEIAHVTLILNGHGVAANALPTKHHRLVEARRSEAFAALGESVTVQEATRVTTDSMGAVARGYGSDIAAALRSLEDDLKRVAS